MCFKCNDFSALNLNFAIKEIKKFKKEMKKEIKILNFNYITEREGCLYAHLIIKSSFSQQTWIKVYF